VLISTLLIVGSFLIVPAFILIGYGFRVARAAALGRPNPPPYDDWGGLIVDGLRFLGMYIAIGIIVGIPLAILQFVAIESGSVVLLLLYFVLSIVVGYAALAFFTAFVGSNRSVMRSPTDRHSICSRVATTLHPDTNGLTRRLIISGQYDCSRPVREQSC